MSGRNWMIDGTTSIALVPVELEPMSTTFNKQTAVAIHWIARGTGLLSVIVLHLLIVGGMQEDRGIPSWTECIGLALFPTGVIGGLLPGPRQPTYSRC